MYICRVGYFERLKQILAILKMKICMTSVWCGWSSTRSFHGFIPESKSTFLFFWKYTFLLCQCILEVSFCQQYTPHWHCILYTPNGLGVRPAFSEKGVTFQCCGILVNPTVLLSCWRSLYLKVYRPNVESPSVKLWNHNCMVPFRIRVQLMFAPDTHTYAPFVSDVALHLFSNKIRFSITAWKIKSSFLSVGVGVLEDGDP